MIREGAIPVEELVEELAAIRRFRPYPEYRESGSQSLDSIPESWRVSRIKHVGRIRYGLGEPPERKDEGILFVRATDIYRGVIRTDAIQRVDPEAVPWARAIILKPGDIVVVRSGAYTGDSAIVADLPETAIAGYDMVIRPSKVYPRFLAYVMLSKYMLEGQVHLARTRAAQPHLNAEELGSFSVLLPSSSEQQAIAAFLDRETARIDELIAKKQRLIVLLAEKRTAHISHAVTKGLNPDAPMKDSGIDRIGQVPEHWQLKKVKYLARILRGKFTHRPRNEPRMYDGPYPFIQTGDIVAAKKYIREYRQTLSEEGFRVSKQFPKGTLVMSIAANIGDMAVLDFEACFPDSIVGFIPVGEADLDFLYHLFTAMRQAFLSTATLNTQLNINIERIGALPSVLPPRDEQSLIVEYLDRAASKSQEIEAKIRQAIERLGEYRSALISAAVTGKIDVRKEVLCPH